MPFDCGSAAGSRRSPARPQDPTGWAPPPARPCPGSSAGPDGSPNDPSRPAGLGSAGRIPPLNPPARTSPETVSPAPPDRSLPWTPPARRSLLATLPTSGPLPRIGSGQLTDPVRPSGFLPEPPDRTEPQARPPAGPARTTRRPREPPPRSPLGRTGLASQPVSPTGPASEARQPDKSLPGSVPPRQPASRSATSAGPARVTRQLHEPLARSAQPDRSAGPTRQSRRTSPRNPPAGRVLPRPVPPRQPASRSASPAEPTRETRQPDKSSPDPSRRASPRAGPLGCGRCRCSGGLGSRSGPLRTRPAGPGPPDPGRAEPDRRRGQPLSSCASVASHWPMACSPPLVPSRSPGLVRSCGCAPAGVKCSLVPTGASRPQGSPLPFRAPPEGIPPRTPPADDVRQPPRLPGAARLATWQYRCRRAARGCRPAALPGSPQARGSS
ncbi:hypothetical protein A4R44_04641 [Amycolatopsis sp. M39]|nr:hypothetical protein A4R44_04641 [Amycolatopsis sp. M39]